MVSGEPRAHYRDAERIGRHVIERPARQIGAEDPVIGREIFAHVGEHSVEADVGEQLPRTSYFGGKSVHNASMQNTRPPARRRSAGPRLADRDRLLDEDVVAGLDREQGVAVVVVVRVARQTMSTSGSATSASYEPYAPHAPPAAAANRSALCLVRDPTAWIRCVVCRRSAVVNFSAIHPVPRMPQRSDGTLPRVEGPSGRECVHRRPPGKVRLSEQQRRDLPSRWESRSASTGTRLTAA